MTILNSSEFYNELTNLLITEGGQESIQTLSNLLLPITKLDATVCKGENEFLSTILLVNLIFQVLFYLLTIFVVSIVDRMRRMNGIYVAN